MAAGARQGAKEWSRALFSEGGDARDDEMQPDAAAATAALAARVAAAAATDPGGPWEFASSPFTLFPGKGLEQLLGAFVAWTRKEDAVGFNVDKVRRSAGLWRGMGFTQSGCAAGVSTGGGVQRVGV